MGKKGCIDFFNCGNILYIFDKNGYFDNVIYYMVNIFNNCLDIF